MSWLNNPHTDPWYLGYAFQGAVVLGTAPIILPILVNSNGGAAGAGLVVALFYVGQLMAPLLGGLTDRTHWYRAVYLAGYALLAAGLGLFALTDNLGAWCLLAFVAGCGAAATNTVSAMFIVEFRPRPEWDKRIGWLQTFYGSGQALGLGLAAALQVYPVAGMLVSAALMAPGAWLGLRGLPAERAHRGKPPAHEHDHRQAHREARQVLSLLHHYRRFNLGSLKSLVNRWKGPFSLFILSWFLTMFGTWIIYNLYPLLMKEIYGIDAGLSSLYYAVAAFLGIFAYAPSGMLGKKIGNAPVVMIGVVMTLVTAAAMLALGLLPNPDNAWLAPLAFLLMPVAWSPLIVAGTAFTAEIATMPEGEAVGIFTAASAVASVLSALAAGGLAAWLGYLSLLVAATLTVLAGMALMLPLLRTGGVPHDGRTEDEPPEPEPASRNTAA